MKFTVYLLQIKSILLHSSTQISGFITGSDLDVAFHISSSCSFSSWYWDYHMYCNCPFLVVNRKETTVPCSSWLKSNRWYYQLASIMSHRVTFARLATWILSALLCPLLMSTTSSYLLLIHFMLSLPQHCTFLLLIICFLLCEMLS